jgi:hypothetical protein
MQTRIRVTSSLPSVRWHLCGDPFTAGASSSQVTTSEARSRSPSVGAPPHFLSMCTTAQTRSVPRPSFPNCRLRGSQRLIPASLQLCHSERVRQAPEFLARPQDHLCYAVQRKRPLSILLHTSRAALPAPRSLPLLRTTRLIGGRVY